MDEARVDGLLALLRDGQSNDIRKHAAQELGRVVTLRSINVFVQQIRSMLRDSNWDIRVAAAQSVGYVAGNRLFKDSLVESCASIAHSDGHMMDLVHLDLRHVISHASPLLKSGGEEYDYAVNYATAEEQHKHLLRQRYLLWKRISHDVQSAVQLPRPILQQSTSEAFIEVSDVLGESTKLDAARTLASSYFPTHSKKSIEMTQQLSMLVLNCFEAVFDSHWEVRHGAAAALREIFVTQNLLTSASCTISIVQAWLEECLVRSLSVLALEQYVDYSADGSIAPVRQLIAQVAGHILPLFPSAMKQTMSSLLEADVWHACHGGLLAIFYISNSVTGAFDSANLARQCLFRSEEEIYCVAAQLLSETNEVNEKMLDRISDILAMIPESGVELSPKYLIDSLRKHIQPRMHTMVPLIMGFLHHALLQVRQAAISWLFAILPHLSFELFDCSDSKRAHSTRREFSIWWLNSLWVRMQREDQLQPMIYELWSKSLGYITPSTLKEVSSTWIPKWAAIAWSIDTTLIYEDTLKSRTVSLTVSQIPDRERAMASCKCISQLLDIVGVSMDVENWLTDWLKSSNAKCVVAALAILCTEHALRYDITPFIGQTQHLRIVKSTALYQTVETMVRQPRQMYYQEQSHGWSLCLQYLYSLRELFSALSSIKYEPTCAGSWALAQEVTKLPFETKLTKPEPYTRAHHIRQDLFESEERIRTSFDRLSTDITGLFAAVYLALKISWEKPAFLVRPLMEGLKTAEDKTFQLFFTNSLVEFIHSFHQTHAACCSKIVGNLVANLAADHGTNRFRGADMALQLILKHPNGVPKLVWEKFQSIQNDMCEPLEILLLTHADISLVESRIINLWPRLKDRSQLSKAVAFAASRSVAVMSSVVSMLQKDMVPDVLTWLVENHTMECVPVACELVTLAMTRMSSTLAHLIPLLSLHDNLQAVHPFLYQLLHGEPTTTIDYDSWPTSLTLRSYQLEGISWLHFLSSHNLNGVLADDMGLGKTLQVLSSIVVQRKKLGKSLSTLIVCPSVVMTHWIREATQYFPQEFCRVVAYSGSATQRKALRSKFLISSHWEVDLLVTTYSILQNDREHLRQSTFDYCVADEVHLCRNPTSQTTQALLSVQATHRIGVSGTPIQNSVVDIWSVFSFIMPGYLGDYPRFKQQTVQPILLSRKESATPGQKEAGALALTQLHAKIAPFVFRRTKEAVLSELPPKQIQDVPCILTPLQMELYKAAESSASTFNMWRTRQQVCIHPGLADSKYISEASGKMESLFELFQLIFDTEHAHRCLLFCHTPKNVELVQRHLAQRLPHINTLKLDGSVPIAQRSDIVDRFNQDPSINVLILTTSIGGLGLNLVTADTVVFLEHSWNPFVDLQAMDRVHRLGQTRAVTVYRLLAQDTIEDEILTAQRFKLAMADTVLGPNESKGGNVLQVLQSTLNQTTQPPLKKAKTTTNRLQGMLSELGELWDIAQYDSLEPPSN